MKIPYFALFIWGKLPLSRAKNYLTENIYSHPGNTVAKKTDRNGRVTVFEYMVRVVANGKTVEYDYDYLNRLVRRNDELFVHRDWQIICSMKNGRIVVCISMTFVLTALGAKKHYLLLPLDLLFPIHIIQPDNIGAAMSLIFGYMAFLGIVVGTIIVLLLAYVNPSGKWLPEDIVWNWPNTTMKYPPDELYDDGLNERIVEFVRNSPYPIMLETIEEHFSDLEPVVVSAAVLCLYYSGDIKGEELDDCDIPTKFHCPCPEDLGTAVPVQEICEPPTTEKTD